MSELKQKALEILRQQKERAIGKHFGLSAEQIAQRLRNEGFEVSTQRIYNILSRTEDVSSCFATGTKKFVLGGDE